MCSPFFLRWRNTPRLSAYLSALEQGQTPAREHEPLAEAVQRRERVLLGLRLDEPLPLRGLDDAVDGEAVRRLERLGLAERREERGGEMLALTARGRFVGGGVTVELLR